MAGGVQVMKPMRNVGRLVIVPASRFLDNAHEVPADSDASPGGNPARSALWENYPVTGFWVSMQDDKDCDPRHLTSLKRLESIQKARLKPLMMPSTRLPNGAVEYSYSR
jgi:hypothetical protein